jgi:hypothetical protein
VYRKSSPSTPLATAATKIFMLLAGMTTLSMFFSPTNSPSSEIAAQERSPTELAERLHTAGRRPC